MANINLKNKLTEKEIQFIENELEFEFNDKELLNQAFTRKSYGIEFNVPYNDILKLVGDSVLNLMVMKDVVDNCQFQYEDGRVITIFENYVEVKELLTSMGYKTIEQFVDTHFIQPVSSSERQAYVIGKRNFDTLMIINKADITNEVYLKKDARVELFKAIIGAVAIDSNWDLEVLQKVFEELIELKEMRNSTNINNHDDYVSITLDYYRDTFNEIPSFEYFFENGVHICKLNFELNGRKYHFEGKGNSKKSSRKSCCEQLCSVLKVDEKLTQKEKISLHLKDFTADNAINVLQELYQKGAIPEPEYKFDVEYDGNGNPIWRCRILLMVTDEDEKTGKGFPNAIDSSKKVVKKKAAFFALLFLKEQLDTANYDFKVLKYNC